MISAGREMRSVSRGMNDGGGGGASGGSGGNLQRNDFVAADDFVAAVEGLVAEGFVVAVEGLAVVGGDGGGGGIGHGIEGSDGGGKYRRQGIWLY
eukprot:CAMPEP_0118688246 /NCGR_PEP_ID=MMETSP0800-20121206/8816_1 /TAXON_ID=210618 ORGANISM="Striatella unipunctata, Strain CCMP2910" /NCGR_SAMPLE_ID=MMETSP0800 /ASSEMBLY_ACC=CAM_ASM_000638 /LENGTH=94 /DNA_ID=CAMNT_0006585489 /DNA_START=93 /DNA_END=375 /DNA_ORIENTATION=+